MYFLLKIGIVHCYVSLLEGRWFILCLSMVYPIICRVFIPLRWCRWCHGGCKSWGKHMQTPPMFLEPCVKCILCIRASCCENIFYIHTLDIMNMHILWRIYMRKSISSSCNSDFPCLPRVVHECRPSTRPMQGTLPLEAHVLLFREDMNLGLHRKPNKNMGKLDLRKIDISSSHLYLEPGIQFYDYFYPNWEVEATDFVWIVDWPDCTKVSTATSASSNSITDWVDRELRVWKKKVTNALSRTFGSVMCFFVKQLQQPIVHHLET